MVRMVLTFFKHSKRQASAGIFGLVFLTLVSSGAISDEPILPPGRLVDSKKFKVYTLSMDENPDDFGEMLDAIPSDHVCLLPQKPRSVDVYFS